jgi:sugar phosphate isomerase/epimerase
MGAPAHPRISVNSLSSLRQSLPDDVAMWRDLAIAHVGLISPKAEAEGWEAARTLVRAAGLRVSNIATEEHVLVESLELAAALGAGCAYICSGGAGTLPWDQAAAGFCARLAPAVSLADRLGVRIGVEPTNPLRCDMSFVFTLRDAIDLARDAGIAVVLDLYSCWYERDFDKLVHNNMDVIALVQVGDYARGTFDTPNRAVIGDGDMPLERLLASLLDAGYSGVFDVEVLGPRIEAEGYAPAVRRSVDRLGDLLERIGA